MLRCDNNFEKPPISPFFAALAVIACVVIFVASISDGEVVSVETWVYRYQALIGGLAAIFAAYFTVAQMRLSDTKSDRRHEDVLALTLRTDALRLDRALGELETLRGEVVGLRGLPLHRLTEDDAAEDEVTFSDKVMVFVAQVQAYSNVLHRSLNFMNADEMNAAKDLFDAVSDGRRKECILALIQAVAHCSIAIDNTHVFDGRLVHFHHSDWVSARKQRTAQVLTAELRTPIEAAIARFSSFAESAGSLRDRYSRHIQR
ncbi:hypothetical protein CN221_14900 [Sinorhizobium meliloti]|uniref:hypothetical protein n=1 Tax=Rhizobium meliloti TaxID=382 RepID=UPI000FE0D51E|nr:hypothetical protein [Sinorhizobium meliloti]RVG94862.1 hypothetical protein CN221_14900 [Sinorhizobium meliloti]RVH65489.1 hypothetical protein CN209_12845 [Sinorhizobium meliloti]